MDDKYVRERIKSVQVVDTYRVEKQELKLSNGDEIVEYSQPKDCTCAYELKMELQAGPNKQRKITIEICN
jgi:hypothetical protein